MTPTPSGLPQRDLAVSKQVPEQEEGGRNDDGEENPIEHGSYWVPGW